MHDWEEIADNYAECLKTKDFDLAESVIERLLDNHLETSKLLTEYAAGRPVWMGK